MDYHFHHKRSIQLGKSAYIDLVFFNILQTLFLQHR
jgi:hypothetical protein